MREGAILDLTRESCRSVRPVNQRLSVGVCVALALCTAQCIGPMSVGVVDGEQIDLSVVSAEWFTVAGVPGGYLSLSSRSDCPGTPPANVARVTIGGLTGGTGTFAVGASLRLPVDGGTGTAPFIHGSGSVQLAVFGPTRATGSYVIEFPGGAQFGASFDVPVCGADAGL
jgi:hypothetical protein